MKGSICSGVLFFILSIRFDSIRFDSIRFRCWILFSIHFIPFSCLFRIKGLRPLRIKSESTQKFFFCLVFFFLFLFWTVIERKIKIWTEIWKWREILSFSEKCLHQFMHWTLNFKQYLNNELSLSLLTEPILIRRKALSSHFSRSFLFGFAAEKVKN